MRLEFEAFDQQPSQHDAHVRFLRWALRLRQDVEPQLIQPGRSRDLKVLDLVSPGNTLDEPPVANGHAPRLGFDRWPAVFARPDRSHIERPRRLAIARRTHRQHQTEVSRHHTSEPAFRIVRKLDRRSSRNFAPAAGSAYRYSEITLAGTGWERLRRWPGLRATAFCPLQRRGCALSGHWGKTAGFLIPILSLHPEMRYG